MKSLDKIYDQNIRDQRYLCTGIDLNPKEKETNEKVYGAIWLDREAGINDILMEERPPGEDGKIILLLSEALPYGGSYRFLFGNVTADQNLYLEVGAIMRIIGSTFAVASEGSGRVESDPSGEAPAVSLGFYSEFPGGVGAAEPVRHAKAYVITYEQGVTYDEYEITLSEHTRQPAYAETSDGEPAPIYLLVYADMSWSMPTRFSRFRDYDKLGEDAIKAALDSQCDKIRIIYKDRSIII